MGSSDVQCFIMVHMIIDASHFLVNLLFVCYLSTVEDLSWCVGTHKN